MAGEVALKDVAPVVLKSRLSADRHPAKVYLARLGPGSRRTMREALDTIAGVLTNGQADAEALDWSALRYQHTAAVRSALAERYAPATTNKALSALRGVLKESWCLGYVSSDDYMRAADLPSVPGEKLPRGRALTMGEIGALFQSCADDHTPAGPRDAAMLALLLGSGMRRSEVVALNREDYAQATGELTIRGGKGNKDRLVYARNGSQDALDAWLEYRGDDPGPLFWPVNKGGRMEPRRITTDALFLMVRKRATLARIAPFSPHDARRTFISLLLERGADISAVKALAGHASVDTTARYDRRGEDAKKRAAELLALPYVRAK